MTEVYLAVYDLSQGMARTLSAQFLGPDHVIDMIPHTAVLVFGKEYFFGGGIQAMDPHSFRSMTGQRPVQTQRLGTTQVSQNEFEAWCQRTGSVKYTVGSYDLLQCNCNHFSHDAALEGLNLSQGIPSWILEVPRRFLSSPMGQMVRPMLEQMQITQTAPVHAPQLTSAPVASPIALSTGGGGGGGGGNPWANISSSSSSASGTGYAAPQISAPQSTAADGQSSPNNQSRPITPPFGSSAPSSILKKYTKPMLSSDTKALSLCASKLVPHVMIEASQLAIQDLAKALEETDSTFKVVNESILEAVVPELWRLVQEGDKAVSFALLFLRIIVLHYASSLSVITCMAELMQALDDQSKSEGEEKQKKMLFPTAASRSLAWCVASNYAGSIKPTTRAGVGSVPTSLVEAAIRDWNHEAVQVRQATCTFLYNFVICNGPRLDHDEETVVSLVCSSMECLVEESDPTTQLRRLVVGARVVFGVHHQAASSSTDRRENDASPSTIEASGCNEMAKDLVQDLGFVSLLQELAISNSDGRSSSEAGHADSKECQQLALELIEKLQSGY